MAAELDSTDAAILECLRQDARLSFRELGERVNLSSNAARDRVRGRDGMTLTEVAMQNNTQIFAGLLTYRDNARTSESSCAFRAARLRSPPLKTNFGRKGTMPRSRCAMWPG